MADPSTARTGFEGIRALTFDCYGTLVDWHRGIQDAFDAVLRGVQADVDRERLVHEREDADFRLIQGPYLPYSDVLERSLREALELQSVSAEQADLGRFAASMARWPPFDETGPILRLLAERFRLVILSNVEAATLRSTVAAIDAPFAALVTAEEIRSYKPAPGHWEAALRVLDLPSDAVLHVAQSMRHDIRPASELGWRCAWINRLGERAPSDVTPDLEVPDLTSLAGRLGA